LSGDIGDHWAAGRRRNAGLSAGVPRFHMLSAMLIVTARTLIDWTTALAE
jgi:hypothetical protein